MNNDLISRDALLKRLEKKKPSPANIKYTDGFNDAIMRVRSMVSTATAVGDVVSVVRCQYCIYFAEAKFNEKGFLICTASGMEITGMDYCSYGERREDG